MLNIVLYQPEIPPNTGNIGRLCVCNDFKLHIIHPIGFSLSKKNLLRAGLDYWELLNLQEHASWNDFTLALKEDKMFDPNQLFLFSSKAKKGLWDVSFEKNCHLVFGCETSGLPKDLHEEYRDSLVTIPMVGKNARCLNLSNAASIASYEAMRQIQCLES